MHILIIDGTNVMGPLVVDILHGQGREVTVFHRGQEDAILAKIGKYQFLLLFVPYNCKRILCWSHLCLFYMDWM